jgi:integrase/recombinase XerD
MNITTGIYHDTRRMKKNSKYPVKLWVTNRGEQRYYPFSSKYDLTKDEFGKVFGLKPRKPYLDIHDVFVSERFNADEIIKSFGDRFSFTLFEKRFKQPEGSSKNVFILLDELSKKLRNQEQISTAVMTECTLSSLKKFHSKKELSLDEIDVDFMNMYEKWMLKNGRANATIGMYGRTIRGIFNTAIKDRVIPSELYPFKEYQIPTGRNFKKALTLSDVALIYNYVPKSQNEAKARDFWLLTYLCNGINMKDIALLKFKNIDGDMIRFERSKTKRANKDKPVIISFVISPDVKRIINRWGNKSVWDGNYIFPIIEAKATPEEIYKQVYNAIKTTNKYTKAICKDLKINAKVTTMVARHSYATVVRNSGKGVEFISEALGHNSIETTKNYLAGFEDDAKKEVAGVLTNFPKIGTGG